MIEPLSIYPGGQWSPRQAQAVMAHLQPELRARGLRIRSLDISPMQGPERCLLQVLCAKHGCVVEEDSACPVCVRS